jgi:hypothetical protein
MSAFENPLRAGPVVLVAAVAEAEGSRAAAAALACAGADAGQASLLVDLGGRPPRPTLLASAAAQKLEQRLVSHLPRTRIAARGVSCHLSAPADSEGLALAASAASVARGCVVAVHLPPRLLTTAVGQGSGPRPSGVLLRAEIRRDRPLVALAVRDLMSQGLAVAVLKRRLGWVVERRALFGAMPPEAGGGIPVRIVRRLSVGLSTGRSAGSVVESKAGSASVPAGAVDTATDRAAIQRVLRGRS